MEMFIAISFSISMISLAFGIDNCIRLNRIEEKLKEKEK